MNIYTLRVWYEIPNYGKDYATCFDVEAEDLESAQNTAKIMVKTSIESIAINFRFDVLNIYIPEGGA